MIPSRSLGRNNDILKSTHTTGCVWKAAIASPYTMCARSIKPHAADLDAKVGKAFQKTGVLPLSSSTMSSPAKPSCATRPVQRSRKGVKGPNERESGFSPAADGKEGDQLQFPA